MGHLSSFFKVVEPLRSRSLLPSRLSCPIPTSRVSWLCSKSVFGSVGENCLLFCFALLFLSGIVINVLSGIMRCDTIAEGVIKAARETGINLPVHFSHRLLFFALTGRIMICFTSLHSG